MEEPPRRLYRFYSLLFEKGTALSCPEQSRENPVFGNAGPESGSSFACIYDSSFYLDRNDSIMDFFTGQKDAR